MRFESRGAWFRLGYLHTSLKCIDPKRSGKTPYRELIRLLLNMAKSTSYSDLLTDVDLKTLEYRRYSHALTLFYKCIYNMGWDNIKETLLFRNNEHDLRGFAANL